MAHAGHDRAFFEEEQAGTHNIVQFPERQPVSSEQVISEIAKTAISDVGGIAPPREDEPPTRTQLLNAAFEANQTDLIEKYIGAALKPAIYAQMTRLRRTGKLKEQEPLVVPKHEKYNILIETLRQNGYVSRESEDAIQLDLTGRIVAGLLANPEIPTRDKAYITGMHKGMVRRVVEELIDDYVINYGVE